MSMEQADVTDGLRSEVVPGPSEPQTPPANPAISRNPYVGPRPFERGEDYLFFARDHEARDLISLVIGNQTLVLYSQSGAGKTSLINALVIDGLQRFHAHVLPVARVQGQIPAEIDEDRISNVFVLNTVLSLEAGTEPGSSTQPEAARERQSVADFLNVGLTQYLKLQKENLKWHDDRPIVLIIDQFEEFFTFYDYRWLDRVKFINQLIDALNTFDELRIVFSLREDYIAAFDPYARLFPNRLRTRYRLDRLRKDGATEAIVRPPERAHRHLADGVAKWLVTELLQTGAREMSGQMVTVEGEFVEAVQLQVVCRHLWDSVPPDEKEITVEHLSNFGNVDDVLRIFYEDTLAEAAKRGPAFDLRIEWPQLSLRSINRLIAQLIAYLTFVLTPSLCQRPISEFLVRRWFASELITAAGTRGTVFREERNTAGMPNQLVDFFANSHLIRGDWRAGGQWYEITHDRLLRPIRASNRSWFKRRRYWSGVVATFLLSAALAAGIYPLLRRADDAAAGQLSASLAAESGRLPFNQLDLAMLLAVQAYRTNDTPLSRSNLFRLVDRASRLTKFGHITQTSILAEAVVPGTSTIAVLTGENQLFAWDYRTGAIVPMPAIRTSGPTQLLADESNIYVVGSSGIVQPYPIPGQKDLPDGANDPAAFLGAASIEPRTLRRIALAGGRLAKASDSNLDIIDMKTRAVVASFSLTMQPDPAKKGAAYRPSMTDLGLSDDGKFAFVLGCLVNPVPALPKSPQPSPDPSVGGADTEKCDRSFIRFWDVDQKKELRDLPDDFDNIPGRVGSVALAHNNGRVLAAVEEGRGLVGIYELTDQGRRTQGYSVGDDFAYLLFASDGDALISVMSGGVASAWSIKGERRLERALHHGLPYDVAVSRSGKLALTGDAGVAVLSNAFSGEPLLLFSYKPFDRPAPYQEVGPVFLHADGCDRYASDDGFPSDFGQRPLVLRPYDQNDNIQGPQVFAEPGSAQRAACALLDDPTVAYVHARSRASGCYLFRIERASLLSG